MNKRRRHDDTDWGVFFMNVAQLSAIALIVVFFLIGCAAPVGTCTHYSHSTVHHQQRVGGYTVEWDEDILTCRHRGE